MSIRIQNVTIDSRDPSSIAHFWADVLGWRITDEEPGEVVLEPPAGSREDGLVPDLVFVPVPETKSVKNRVHFDLRPDDQQAEVARVKALGAKRVNVGQRDDVSWVVLADPEGNEFCILRALTPEELTS